MTNVLEKGEWHWQKDSPSFGGLGLFARQSIPKGQNIFSETPCFTIGGTIPSPLNVLTKMRGVDNPSGKIFARLESGLLLPARDQDLNHLDEAGKAAVGASPSRMAVFRHLISNNLGASGHPGPQQGHNFIGAAATLVGIFEQNRFLLNGEIAGGKAQRCGFFPRAARLNHSCKPNCYASWDADSQQLRLHAVSEITNGDELTIMYNEAFLAFCPKSLRHRWLNENFGFGCRFPACADTPEGRTCEHASRVAAEELAKYGLLSSSQVPRETALQLLKLCFGIQIELDMQKINTWSNGLLYVSRAQWYNLRSKREDAVEHLGLAREHASVCFGKDGAVTKKIEGVLHRAKESNMKELDDLVVGLTQTANDVQAGMAALGAQAVER